MVGWMGILIRAGVAPVVIIIIIMPNRSPLCIKIVLVLSNELLGWRILLLLRRYSVASNLRITVHPSRVRKGRIASPMIVVGPSLYLRIVALLSVRQDCGLTLWEWRHVLLIPNILLLRCGRLQHNLLIL